MILRSELGALRDIIRNLSHYDNDVLIATDVTVKTGQLQKECERISASWMAAVLSDTPDHALQRYFNIHQEGIRELSDTLFADSQQNGAEKELIIQWNTLLNSLIGMMQCTHGRYFDWQANTPLFHRTTSNGQSAAHRSRLVNKLNRGSFSSALKDCLLNYLKEIDANLEQGFCSYHALEYQDHLVAMFEKHHERIVTDSDLEFFLTSLNFNRIQYLKYHQARVRSKISLLPELQEKVRELQQEQILLFSFPAEPKISCQHGYPPLTTMLEEWINEQVRFLEQEMIRAEAVVPAPAKSKIPLNLSVAQIAYIIKLLVDAEILNLIPLTDIFKFVADNFSSKKREAISPGSLSKEYYSVSQFTAARVLAWFEKIVGRIIRDFFPLLVVISVIARIS